jgi:hypothetical protein
VEGELHLQEIPKPIPIPKKRTPRKKVIVMKIKKIKKLEKIGWMVKYYTSLV